MNFKLFGNLTPSNPERFDSTSDKYWMLSGNVAPFRFDSCKLWMYSNSSDDGNVTSATDVSGFPPRYSCAKVLGRAMPSNDLIMFQLKSKNMTVLGTAKLLNVAIVFDANIL